jgi:hypothetical protein
MGIYRLSKEAEADFAEFGYTVSANLAKFKLTNIIVRNL